MKYINVILSIGLLIASMQYACTTDKLVEPKPADDCVNYDATYDGEIKLIIDINCAHSGCHNSGGGAPGEAAAAGARRARPRTAFVASCDID